MNHFVHNCRVYNFCFLLFCLGRCTMSIPWTSFSLGFWPCCRDSQVSVFAFVWVCLCMYVFVWVYLCECVCLCVGFSYGLKSYCLPFSPFSHPSLQEWHMVLSYLLSALMKAQQYKSWLGHSIPSCSLVVSHLSSTPWPCQMIVIPWLIPSLHVCRHHLASGRNAENSEVHKLCLSHHLRCRGHEVHHGER